MDPDGDAVTKMLVMDESSHAGEPSLGVARPQRRYRGPMDARTRWRFAANPDAFIGKGVMDAATAMMVRIRKEVLL